MDYSDMIEETKIIIRNNCIKIEGNKKTGVPINLSTSSDLMSER